MTNGIDPARRIRIGVDAMGGDAAPGVVVEGAIDLLKDSAGVPPVDLILVGDERLIQEEIRRHHAESLPLKVFHAAQRIGMSEGAATSFRRKRDSSIVMATRLLHDRETDAVVSAGHTGAVVTASLLVLGRLKGVIRPAIASLVPTETGSCVMLDVGATTDCKPQNLLQFAIMGSIYARHMLDIPEPRVGLLNIGEENSKGSELALESHKLLREQVPTFIGNVEGRDIFRGSADVVVTDGFTGNVLLKFAESVIGFLTTALRREILKGPRTTLGGLLLKPALVSLRRKLDYAEYGGAPLLGVNGVCIIGHGSSSPKAIRNALRAAAAFATRRVNDRIREEFEGWRVKEAWRRERESA